MKANIKAQLFGIALLAASLVAASDIPFWPVAEKQAAIARCRLSIISQAEQDYLKRHNLKEVPSGFRERIQPAIEPYLATCDCALGEMEKEWSFEYFMTHQPEVPAKISQIVRTVCAIPSAPPRDAAVTTPQSDPS